MAPQPDQQEESLDRRARRRDEKGIMTMEWLVLIGVIAFVAIGGTLVVRDLVETTAEQIGSSQVRLVAAQATAEQVAAEAQLDTQPPSVTTWGEWEIYYGKQCRRIAIAFADANVDATPKFEIAGNLAATNGLRSGGSGTVVLPNAVTFTTGEVDDASAPATPSGTTSPLAVAWCGVTAS